MNLSAQHNTSLTIGELIDYLTSRGPAVSPTVDKLLYGEPDTTITSVAVTFLATQSVIKQAAELGANLIISHEHPYYNHNGMQHEQWKEDAVAQNKHLSIMESGIAIFRYHDHCHREQIDLITDGLVRQLEWEPYMEQRLPAASIAVLPSMSAADIAEHIKHTLRIPYVRLIGDPSQACSRVAITVGYRGGGNVVLPLLREQRVQLVIAGEGPEWEAPEYVRDAREQGLDYSMIMLGHAESEAPGMRYIAQLLAEQFPHIAVHTLIDKPLYAIL
ncbi:Nif3-like dinuclear metal center hexameric protein [Paenibacillus sp. IITD108]|uniref:Nif3-like dinuclear metal center hexameric protein n=1 Tax=Paenibacillus sp. IITD108 TaxID=3116649 RepID=UPI002F412C31